jgi:hypothetical protein
MRKTTKWLVRAAAVVIAGMLLLGSAPTASAARRGVVIVQPAPFWGPGPLWWGGYWWDPYYPYSAFPGDYISAHYGFVKIDKHHQDKNDSVYIDGGYAAKLKNAGKFALRPGNHKIELRDPRGHSIFQERVAVMIGKTTKVEVPS